MGLNFFEKMLSRQEMEDDHKGENNPVAETIQKEKQAAADKKEAWEEKQAAGKWSEKSEPGATEEAHAYTDERVGGTPPDSESIEKRDGTNG